MLRLILISLLFIASLVIFFPVPAKQVWYVGIAIPEYPWIFIITCFLLLIWSWFSSKYRLPSLVLGVVTFFILCSPVVRAINMGTKIDADLAARFAIINADMSGFYQHAPFSVKQMFKGNGAKEITYTTYAYSPDSAKAMSELTLNFYPAAKPGKRPCLVEVHGGSWKHGDNSEIAHFNNYIANTGINVATINYRLAPANPSPAQAEDIHAAFEYLRLHADELNIDTTNFLLSGRSAGAQLVLATAYAGRESGVKGVAAFYGPTDMWWTWEHPDNPLIMDSRQVQKDFLGGSPKQVPDRYNAESPLFYAGVGRIPTLLIHGQNDAHVFYEQSVRLAAKLDSLHVPNYLLSLPWATHGCEFNLNGPSGQLAMYCVDRFFESVTRK